MNEQLQSILSNITALGSRRLMAMAAVALLVVGTIGFGAYYMNRPAFDTLYVGLDRDDVNRIGTVLADSGITYDVDSEGSTVLVEAGKTSRARMLLAEKGLPGSSGAGYELFDNLGSLGLTSFMQEVTRVRALEGEIARSIQAINGVKAARVHIVMPERSGFAGRNQEPSASVLVRLNNPERNRSALAIRHLVAAAVPGLSSDNVTVLDATGRVLAAGEDPANGQLTSALGVERTVEDQLERNIASALTPYLGAMNFRTSVQARLDTDRRQTEETIYDPDSRVERSVQVVKTQDSATQKSSAQPTTVEQNLPEEDQQSAGGAPQSSENSERREETTNYELSTKRVATVSSGYTVEKLSVAIVVNRERLVSILGPNASEADFDARIAGIQKMAATAAGYDEARGDVINVTAVEFVEDFAAVESAGSGIMDTISANVGTAINAGAFILVSLIVIFVGLRPLSTQIAAVVGSRPPSAADGGAAAQMVTGEDFESLAAPDAAPVATTFEKQLEDDTDSILSNMKQLPQERLEALVDFDQERTAQVLRRWINQEAA